MLFPPNNQFYTKLFTTCFLGLFLITTLPALAEYQPPPQPDAPSCTDTTSCRGCAARR